MEAANEESGHPRKGGVALCFMRKFERALST